MSELGSQVYLAFAAGLLSVLSPCVLPLMPAYLSLISGITVEEMQEGGEGVGKGALRRRVMRSCVAFVLGFGFEALFALDFLLNRLLDLFLECGDRDDLGVQVDRQGDSLGQFDLVCSHVRALFRALHADLQPVRNL